MYKGHCTLDLQYQSPACLNSWCVDIFCCFDLLVSVWTGKRSGQRWDITKAFGGRHPACDQTLFGRLNTLWRWQRDWQQAAPAASCFRPANFIMFKGLGENHAGVAPDLCYSLGNSNRNIIACFVLVKDYIFVFGTILDFIFSLSGLVLF